MTKTEYMQKLKETVERECREEDASRFTAVEKKELDCLTTVDQVVDWFVDYMGGCDQHDYRVLSQLLLVRVNVPDFPMDAL